MTSEALYLKHVAVADRYPVIYANLSVSAGKQAKYAEAIEWADKALSAAQRILAVNPHAAVDLMHPVLVKASWLWESGKQVEAKALFASVAVPGVGDSEESTYWGCRACFYGSVGDQTELTAAIGIAETGSLVFHSGPGTAVLGHFLPLHHVAVLHARDIVGHLEDYAPDPSTLPRNLNLITGASGTTDIEGSYVRGAHGPRHLHIVLVGD